MEYIQKNFNNSRKIFQLNRNSETVVVVVVFVVVVVVHGYIVLLGLWYNSCVNIQRLYYDNNSTMTVKGLPY